MWKTTWRSSARSARRHLPTLREQVDALAATDRAIVGSFGGTGFGDIALVPGMGLKHPKGIRAVEEWYVSMSMRPDYIYEMFDRQCAIALQNLERIHAVVGDRVSVVFLSGTDFGAQNGPFISPKTYRKLFKPFYRRVNDWVHKHTTWKTFIHTCGSVWRLLDDLIESGFDIYNPVQTSAAEMDPVGAEAALRRPASLSGAAASTPSGCCRSARPAEIRSMVRDRMRIFGPGGGFVFNPVHNVQTGIPIENLLALYEAVREYRAYPLA